MHLTVEKGNSTLHSLSYLYLVVTPIGFENCIVGAGSTDFGWHLLWEFVTWHTIINVVLVALFVFIPGTDSIDLPF